MFWNRQVVCPACRSASALRVNRTGFLQHKVFGLFGIYPWKCGACGSTFFCRRRGHRSHSESPVPDTTSHS
jgi:hypothetical protein